MTITRRGDGLYTSDVVRIRVGRVRVPVSAVPYVGKTRAEVISQVLSNTQVLMWRKLLTAKFKLC